MLVYVYRKDLPLVLRGRDLQYLRPDPRILAMLAKRGVPTAAETLIVHNNQPNDGSTQDGGFINNTTETEQVNYSETLEFLTVHGQDGNDTFDVQPSQTAEITINGPKCSLSFLESPTDCVKRSLGNANG